MQLLKIEWLKIKNYTTFWVLNGIFVGLYLLWNLGLNQALVKLGSQPINVVNESFRFPGVWGTMGYVYGWFIFFLCMFIIISIANEVTFRTQRQHIIDGFHRLDFLHAKSLLILAMSIATTIMYTLFCLGFGLANGGSGVFDEAHYILYVFIYTLNYLSFAALLTLFIKRTGLSIILFLAYLLLESGISTYVNFRFATKIGNLLPLQASDELLPSKSLAAMKSMVDQASHASAIPEYIFLLVSLVFIALYYFIARRKMLNSDL